ncbi:MAG: hypothetical protein WBN40_10795, partial [Pseudomonadales bacterium]
GYAVLVQGRAPGGVGEASYAKTTQRVYDALKLRNFDDADIYYFNYDDTLPGVDFDPDAVGKAGLQNIFTDTAVNTSLSWKMNNEPAPLYVVMVDHGNIENGASEFLFDNELDNPDGLTKVSVKPIELSFWLRLLENQLSPAAALEPRVIVNGFCYSGGFISALSGVNGTLLDTPRVLVTSADPFELSYKGPVEEDGIRSGEFFIEEFFKAMARGEDLRSGFVAATEITERFTLRDDANAFDLATLDHAVQHPQLDDNNDGLSSNVINTATSDTAFDGVYAASVFLGTSTPLAINQPVLPEVVAVTDTTFLDVTPGDNTVQLTLRPESLNPNQRAYVDIREPGTMLPGGDLSGSGISEQGEVDSTRVTLFAPGTNGCPVDQYCRAQGGFDSSGRYDIFYYLEDIDTGVVTPATRSIVYKNDPSNTAPASFELISPANGAVTTVNAAIFLWQASADLDGDRFSYSVVLCEDAALTVNCRAQEELRAPATKFVGLKDNVDYYWRAAAIDNFGAITNSNSVFTFRVALETNSIIGVVEGLVQSNLDFSLLSNFSVQRVDAGIPQEFVSAQTAAGDGVYLLLTLFGAAQIQAEAPDFATNLASVTVPPPCTSASLAAGACVPQSVQYDFVMASTVATPPPPTDQDYDGDGISDAADTDDDNDGLPDVFEANYLFLDSKYAPDAGFDFDNDGLTNLEEFEQG